MWRKSEGCNHGPSADHYLSLTPHQSGVCRSEREGAATRRRALSSFRCGANRVKEPRSGSGRMHNSSTRKRAVLCRRPTSSEAPKQSASASGCFASASLDHQQKPKSIFRPTCSVWRDQSWFTSKAARTSSALNITSISPAVPLAAGLTLQSDPVLCAFQHQTQLPSSPCANGELLFLAFTSWILSSPQLCARVGQTSDSDVKRQASGVLFTRRTRHFREI